MSGVHEHDGKPCPVEILARGEAVRRLAERYAARDSYLVTMGGGTVSPVLRRTRDLADWVLYADQGSDEVLTVHQDSYYAAYLGLLDFAVPGSVATVLVVPRSEEATAYLGAAMGGQVKPETDIVVAALSTDGPVPYPVLLVEAIESVDPVVGLALRSSEVPNLN